MYFVQRSRNVVAGEGCPVTDLTFPAMGTPDSKPRFVVVCTANICRSPMAEALLRNHLEMVGVDATVLSSGHLDGGVRVSENSVKAMADRFLDISHHRSVTTTREVIDGAELILTMGRQHVRQVLEVDMGAWPHTFPLRAAVRRAQQLGPRARDETVSEWVERLHHGRRAADMLADNPDDDVEDPIGMSIRVYRDTAKLLDDLLGQLVGLMYPTEL